MTSNTRVKGKNPNEKQAHESRTNEKLSRKRGGSENGDDNSQRNSWRGRSPGLIEEGRDLFSLILNANIKKNKENRRTSEKDMSGQQQKLNDNNNK